MAESTLVKQQQQNCLLHTTIGAANWKNSIHQLFHCFRRSSCASVTIVCLAPSLCRLSARRVHQISYLIETVIEDTFSVYSLLITILTELM
jgi:hypothetical protein